MAQTAENGGASFEGGFDLAEVRISKDEESFLWESAWSYGDEQDRILLKLDGGGQLGNRINEIVSQLLYARSVSSSTMIVAVSGTTFSRIRMIPMRSLALNRT